MQDFMQDLLKNSLLMLLGISGGITVAGGLFAFLTVVGVVTRLAAGTKTAKNLLLYEDISLFGLIAGNVIYLYTRHMAIGVVGLAIYGIGAGVFTGCLAAALAEVVNVLPVLERRVKLKTGMSCIILVFAIGKLVGSLIQLLFQ